MLKLIVTDAVVSRGYDSNPALRFFNGENGSSVHFRIGKRVYDSRCEDKHRWINLNVKAFGDMCERIKKMKLKEGSYVNIVGKYDEEVKEDQNTKETRRYPVVIVEEIEYCYSGSGQKNAQNNGVPAQGQPPAQAQSQPPAPAQGQQGAPFQSQYGTPPQGQPQGQSQDPPAPLPDNFTGYEGLYGGENRYF